MLMSETTMQFPFLFCPCLVLEPNFYSSHEKLIKYFFLFYHLKVWDYLFLKLLMELTSKIIGANVFFAGIF